MFSHQTVSAIYSFFLAMTLYPEVQKKAQAELDAVIGPDRLPSFEDKENLPYVSALCSEVMRWMPVAPLGMSHVVLSRLRLYTLYNRRSSSSARRRRIQWVFLTKEHNLHS